MFHGLFGMNDPCPVCGLVFRREEGSFLGAMYVSYAISSAIIAVAYFIALALLPGWGSISVALVALVPLLLLTPTVYRYSRVLWVHLDHATAPEDPVGPYERLRLTGQHPRRDGGPGRS
jgi:hypothetical protein